jgi:hypothetical protein
MDEAADFVDFIKEIRCRQFGDILRLTVQPSVQPATSSLLTKAQLFCGGRAPSGSS